MPAEHEFDLLAERLRAEAEAQPFPPTPDLALRERRRLAESGVRGAPALLRRSRLVVAVVLLLAALVAVPEVRAAARRIWQLGVVQVLVEPAPPSPAPSPVASPVPTLDLGLAGSTTLAAAAEELSFPLRLPGYPVDIGPPDLVYLQELDGAALLLVWLDPADRASPVLSLHALTSDAIVRKTMFGEETELLAETSVGGRPALWVRGPHFVQVGRAADAWIEPRRIVAGNTLIWTVDELTYRLETGLPLEEAVRIAESLR